MHTKNTKKNRKTEIIGAQNCSRTRRLTHYHNSEIEVIKICSQEILWPTNDFKIRKKYSCGRFEVRKSTVFFGTASINRKEERNLWRGSDDVEMPLKTMNEPSLMTWSSSWSLLNDGDGGFLSRTLGWNQTPIVGCHLCHISNVISHYQTYGDTCADTWCSKYVGHIMRSEYFYKEYNYSRQDQLTNHERKLTDANNLSCTLVHDAIRSIFLRNRSARSWRDRVIRRFTAIHHSLFCKSFIYYFYFKPEYVKRQRAKCY